MYIIYLLRFFSQTRVKWWLFDDPFLALYPPPFFQTKRAQTGFVICYVTFDSLQNGEQNIKKKRYAGDQNRSTMPIIGWLAYRKASPDGFQKLPIMKNFISKKLGLHPGQNWNDKSFEKWKKIFDPPRPWGGVGEFWQNFFFSVTQWKPSKMIGHDMLITLI